MSKTNDNIIRLPLQRDDDAGFGPPPARRPPRGPRPRSPEVQAKLDRLKTLGFDPDADAKLSFQEKLDRMEAHQKATGFDPQAEGRKIMREYAARQAALDAEEAANPRPKPAPLTDDQIAEILKRTGDSGWVKAAELRNWRIVPMDEPRPMRRDDSANAGGEDDDYQKDVARMQKALEAEANGLDFDDLTPERVDAFDRIVAEAAAKAQRRRKRGRKIDEAEAQAPNDDSNHLTIELRIGETERIVDEIENALIRSDRGLYRRGGLIVSTGFDKMQTWDGRTIEVQIIEERNNYALLEDIEAVASFEKYDRRAKKWRRTPPTLPMALTLRQRTTRLRLPNLVSVVNCPTIKANGELIAEPSFYSDLGILFEPRGVQFPPVPQRPDKAMAQTALKQIMRLVATFDFVSPDDKAVALSLILTAIARPGLPTAPLHGFDAPVAGSGKSKLVDIASILATGHEAGVTAQGETREEAEKRFSTLLMRGDLIIAIDNCEAPLEGVVFNQALTQQWANLRILGQSKAIRVRCAALITATGNNLIVKGDLTRRSIVCRLDPKVERPELRQFTYDPVADAKANRGALVAAALTILRAHHVAGRPNRPPRLQSFEQWSDTVRGALVWLGAGDPAATMNRLRKADPVLASLTAVLHAWREAFGSEPVTARQAIEATGYRDDLRDALTAVAGRGGKIEGRVLGNWLAHHAADRVVNLADDLAPQLVAMEAYGQRLGVALWRLSKRE